MERATGTVEIRGREEGLLDDGIRGRRGGAGGVDGRRSESGQSRREERLWLAGGSRGFFYGPADFVKNFRIPRPLTTTMERRLNGDTLKSRRLVDLSLSL